MNGLTEAFAGGIMIGVAAIEGMALGAGAEDFQFPAEMM